MIAEPKPDSEPLSGHLDAERRAVDAHLRMRLRGVRGVPARLKAAMGHSLFGGGKRLRPVLLLWAYDALRTRRAVAREHALDAACALEMIHTYSLIHDDLPAMDDDVLRRGRPTCHVAYDEATAILAGDGLLTLAFGILAEVPVHGAALVREVAAAAGPAGMVGGQQLDLEAEGVEPTANLVRRIHRDKTARLIAAPLAAGARLAGAGTSAIDLMSRAGIELGLAFQAADDLLDVEGDAERLGKSPGKDAAAGKATWVSLKGLEAARARTRRHGRRGLILLADALPGRTTRARRDAAARLEALGRRLWERDR